MKKTTVLAIQALCVIFCSSLIVQTSVQAGNITWQTDLKAAAKESSRTKKPMLLKITADWCFYCKKMKKSFEQKEVAKHVNSCFIPVLVDADKHKKLVKAIGVDGLPTTVIITPKYKVIKKITGYKKANDLGRELETICQVNHTQIAKQQKYIPKKHSAFSQPAIATPPQRLQQTESTKPISPTPQKRTVKLENPFGNSDPKQEMKVKQQPTARKNPFAGTNQFAEAPQIKIAPPTAVPTPKVEDVKTKFAFSELCLVSLLDERFLTEGNAKFTAQYRNVTLCFASKRYRDQFEKNPKKYWPVLDGACVISQIDDNAKRQGDPETGAVYRGKLWFFNTAEQRQKFAKSPKKYAQPLQQK